jgi:hypothetical protein
MGPLTNLHFTRKQPLDIDALNLYAITHSLAMLYFSQASGVQPDFGFDRLRKLAE